MKPIEFKEQNVIYGEEQEEYIPLPALKQNDVVVSCWQLSKKELQLINETGVIWLSVMNFKNSLQPVYLSVEKSDVIQAETV